MNSLQTAFIRKSHTLQYHPSSPYRLDITAVNALKGAAVHFYTQKYQISLKDTMVIGDSENDYSMLGLPYIESIAMGNADDIIQEICLHHTAG